MSVRKSFRGVIGVFVHMLISLFSFQLNDLACDVGIRVKGFCSSHTFNVAWD